MNKSLILLLSLLGVLALSSNLQAEEQKKLYKWTDASGNVHFSDEPHPGATEIEMKQVPTIKLKLPKAGEFDSDLLVQSNDGENSSSEEGYTSASFVEPQDQGVVRNNASSITFSAAIIPQLIEGHRVQFSLDGLPVSEETANADTQESALPVVVATNVEYGEHSASFVIVNANGDEIFSSETIHFHLLHLNINNRQ